jgi:hypothetical protein
VKSLELMLVQLALVHRRGLDVLGEPLLELLVVVEQFWHDEMKEGPKFSH